MTKIVVTGSEGSLMQNIIPRLLAKGHTVVGIDNLYRYGQKSAGAGIDYEFYEQDLVDREAVLQITKGADYIIHAAAKLYGVLGLLHYRADILSDDTNICSNILQSAVSNNVKRVVYMSSSMVYDACVQDKNISLTEDMPAHAPMPKTDYGLSKLVCERMCEAFYQQYALEYTIWRPFNIVNPAEECLLEQGFSHVLPDFVNNLAVKKLNPLPIIGDGEQIRCFTWVDDVGDIITDHSFEPETKNQVYNVCNVEPISMKDTAKLIYSKLGYHAEDLQFVTSKNYEHDVKVRIPSVEKLRAIIGDYRFTDTSSSIEKCLNL